MAAHNKQIFPAFWSSLLGLISTLASSDDQYSAIVPPPGNDPILSFIGKGTQIYQCYSLQFNGLSYLLQGAEAELYAYTTSDELDNVSYIKRRWGYHYFLTHPDGEGGRPTFATLASPTDNDSSIPTSTATFKLIASVAPSNPKDIPSLLLRATSHSGNGPLSMVSYAQRVNAIGGAPPKGNCKTEGAVVRVPYTAHYRFWSQSQIPTSSVPQSISVPQGHTFLASFFGLGFQIYTFNGSQWILSNATATLSALPGTPALGRHYFSSEGRKTAAQPQPTWEFFSPRGHVSAKLIQKVQKMDVDIPWLLAQATSYIGRESFAARVGYVQRLSTVGGMAPASSAGARPGDVYCSAYSAIYSFYGS